MYLSRLEILGFKSFQQKTDVKFNPGLTGIVGPNGCGKSNIVDAIRWCLGEQKSSILRSDKMENVIFNGTSTKKPMGMAEVSLVIQNHKGLLPSEYNEVVITRRIFRSGESEYLLNRNLCRLKDITSLFMDTGMGANAYSVIELKMVESILSNKADERRGMFEEAAGVNKYKVRRRLSLKKLDEVRTDLNRVNDILSEVEKRVATLERQAKRADKYNILSQQLKDLELDFNSRKLAAYEIEKMQMKGSKDELAGRRAVIDAEIEGLETNLTNLKTELEQIEDELRNKRNEITQLTEKIHTESQAVSVTDERRKSLQKNIYGYEKEIQDYKSDQQAAGSLIEEYTEKIEILSVDLKNLELRKTELEEQRDAITADVAGKREAVEEHSRTLLEKHKELSYLENEIEALKKALVKETADLTRLREGETKQKDTAAKASQYLEHLTKDKTDTEGHISAAEAELVELQTQKEQLEAALQSLRKKEAQERSVLASVKDKISFIKNLVDNLEGFSKGSKILMENSGWAGGSKNLLGNLGTTPDKFRLALESALKNNINNIIVNSIDDILSGIELLKSGDSGKASFYYPNHNSNTGGGFLGFVSGFMAGRRRKKVVTEKGFISWAYDVVETEATWKSYFKSILGDVVITEDLNSSLALAKKYPDFTFTTLEGDIVYPSGVIEAGAIPSADETIFGRKKLLEELQTKLPEHEAQVDGLLKEIEELENNLQQIDLKSVNDRIKVLNNELNSIQRQLNQFEYEKQKASEEADRLGKEAARLSAAIEANTAKISEEEAKLAKYKEAISGEEEVYRNKQEEFKQSEEKFSSHITALNDTVVSIERMNGEIRNLTGSIKNSEQNLDAMQKGIEKRTNDITTAKDELDYLDELNAERRTDLTELQNQRETLREEERKIDVVSREKKVEVTESEGEVATRRKEKDNLADEIYRIDIALNQLGLNISNLIEHTVESYGVEPEVKNFDDLETFDFEGVNAQIHELKQFRKNLGAINFDAYTEYEEEKTRFEFMEAQRTDLVAAESDLMKTIEEINETAQSLFMTTFNQIREYYINIFRSLFNPGDEADLRLEEEADPLEAKIEIIAKPKGKRPLTIEQLSGGEKTLTAIALLFAIYMVKPSPFCILDEIDAPLDDANIDRFTKIIRDFSKDTQFIIITHNKRTMEATDALYGITMQEVGVSKLVSVKFNEELGATA